MLPIFKKKDKVFVQTYRLVSVLPTVSKIFERIMRKRISDYIGKFLDFRTQYALSTPTERWKFCLDKLVFTGALLMDLSKAFDKINHELLIVKLHAYGLSIDALEVFTR